MPLKEFNSSGILKNKQNNKDIDPQSISTNSPIKPINKNSPIKKSINAQINQLKIKLSDRQFQLKRVQQDCIVKIGLMQKQLTKQKNEKKQIIKQSKQKLEQDKHYYQTKIIMLQQEYKNRIQQTKRQIRKQTQYLVEKQRNKLIQKYNQEINSLNKQIKQNQLKYDKEKQVMFNNHNKEINVFKTKHKEQLHQVYVKHESQINQLKLTHSNQIKFYSEMQNQKSKQQNVITKILNDKIKLLQQQLKNKKLTIHQLTTQINTKNQQLSLQRKYKEEFRLDKICLERKLNKLQPDLLANYQTQLNQAKYQFQNKINHQIQKFNQLLNSLNKLHSQSISNYQTQITQLQERCKQISTLHSTIKSNQEDIKKIQTLEMKLIRKQMELQKQKEDVKMLKLQLNNMDQIMQKMFQQAKLKSLKTKKHRLPSLLAVPQNRSTMDCYVNTISQSKQNNTAGKQNKKFSIRQLNYHSICKPKQILQSGIYD